MIISRFPDNNITILENPYIFGINFNYTPSLISRHYAGRYITMWYVYYIIVVCLSWKHVVGDDDGDDSDELAAQEQHKTNDIYFNRDKILLLLNYLHLFFLILISLTPLLFYLTVVCVFLLLQLPVVVCPRPCLHQPCSPPPRRADDNNITLRGPHITFLETPS